MTNPALRPLYHSTGLHGFWKEPNSTLPPKPVDKRPKKGKKAIKAWKERRDAKYKKPRLEEIVEAHRRADVKRINSMREKLGLEPQWPEESK